MCFLCARRRTFGQIDFFAVDISINSLESFGLGKEDQIGSAKRRNKGFLFRLVLFILRTTQPAKLATSAPAFLFALFSRPR